MSRCTSLTCLLLTRSPTQHVTNIMRQIVKLYSQMKNEMLQKSESLVLALLFLYRNILVSCLFLQPLPADLTLLLKLLTKVFEPSRNWAIQPNLLLGPIGHSGQKPHFFKTFKNVWKLLKMSHFIFWVLAFSTNFCPIKRHYRRKV